MINNIALSEILKKKIIQVRDQNASACIQIIFEFTLSWLFFQIVRKN